MGKETKTLRACRIGEKDFVKWRWRGESAYLAIGRNVSSKVASKKNQEIHWSLFSEFCKHSVRFLDW